MQLVNLTSVVVVKSKYLQVNFHTRILATTSKQISIEESPLPIIKAQAGRGIKKLVLKYKRQNAIHHSVQSMNRNTLPPP